MLSLEELVAATGISKDILTQVLSQLVKVNILMNENTEEYDLNLSMTSVFVQLSCCGLYKLVQP